MGLCTLCWAGLLIQGGNSMIDQNENLYSVRQLELAESSPSWWAPVYMLCHGLTIFVEKSLCELMVRSLCCTDSPIRLYKMDHIYIYTHVCAVQLAHWIANNTLIVHNVCHEVYVLLGAGIRKNTRQRCCVDIQKGNLPLPTMPLDNICHQPLYFMVCF